MATAGDEDTPSQKYRLMPYQRTRVRAEGEVIGEPGIESRQERARRCAQFASSAGNSASVRFSASGVRAVRAEQVGDAAARR